MQDQRHSPARGWGEKFRDAFRGIKIGVRGQSSFFVHFFMAAAVVVAAVVLRVSTAWEWCVLLLCIAVVLAAEMFNTALESMARAIADDMDPDLGNALDIGSAAVLVASLGAAIAGAIVFVNRLGQLFQWWL